MDGPHSRSGQFREEKRLLLLPGLEPQTIQTYPGISIELSLLKFQYDCKRVAILKALKTVVLLKITE
jgi:hypothetical protein